jgi:predicted DNA-binding ribbon-helix-helix protein
MVGRPSGIAKRSVTVAGHRTSLSLESAFWDALHRIARNRGMSVSRLVAEIDRAAEPGATRRNLSSAVRVFVLDAVRAGDDRP